MGSTSFLGKSKGFRTKSGSSGSEKEMNGKLKRSKIRRPAKMNEYGMKRIPDYTELAYKEAVSKLKYFLTGNSAPSVRSYGGSASIKNLDESDGDLDKKYSTSFNTLSEYKPRPRLTAKYATLYADSLNYPAPQPTPTVPPPASDLNAGTNPDVVNFIQKQEEYIEQLERESQYCRDELNNLLGKVKEVISENEHLHDAQKNKLISRMFHTYNAGSETDDLDDVGDSTGLDSDNKISPTKTRRPKSRSTRLEGPNIVFESRIAELEAQLTQAKIDLKKIQDENNENKRKLANGLVDSTCLDGFKRQIDNLQRDKSTLESQISKLKLSLEQKDGDLDTRYKKGSDGVEQQLREERNNLEMEIRRLKDDLTKERNKVRELAGEGARRAIQERSAAEQRYNAHFDELQHDLAAQYDNVAKLQLDLERQRREENDLKRELSMKNAAVEELKMELKNKSASLQADLAQAYAEKASLEEELASARLAIERQQRQSKHEANRLNSEIQSLRQRLDRADADLVHSRRENLRLSEQISTLEKEINMKNLTPFSPEKKKEKELSTMFESMENKHAKTVAELESMIHSQNSLMEKLTSECRLLTDKLDDANRRHKQSAESQPCRRTNQNTARPVKIPRFANSEPSITTPRKRVRFVEKELATLQRQVENLGQSFQSSYSHPPSNYQAPTSHPAETSRISSSPPGSRPDNTRTESPRDATFRQNVDVGNLDGDNETPRIVDQHMADPNPDHFTAKSNGQDYNNDVQEAQNYNTQENQDTTQTIRKMSKQNSRDSNEKDDNTLRRQSKDMPQQQVLSNNSEMDSTNVVDTEENVTEQTPHAQETDYTQEQQYTEHAEYPIESDKQPEQTEQYDNQNYNEENYQQNYDPNFEQQQYNTEQYENYEQYPQQFEDPNAQYEGQYENYATDGNYSEQTYDNTQYNQEYTTEYPETGSEHIVSDQEVVSGQPMVSEQPLVSNQPMVTEQPQAEHKMETNDTVNEKLVSQS